MARIPKSILFFFFLLILPIVSSEYWDFLTIGQGDRRYCRLLGNCEVNSLTVQNLSVIGGFFNVSVINYNVTGTLSVGGNVTADYYFGNGSKLTGLNEIYVNHSELDNGTILRIGDADKNCSASGSCSPNVAYMNFPNQGDFYINGSVEHFSNDTNKQMLYMRSASREYQGEVPSDISNLFAHWDFNDTTTITKDGDNRVSLVDDLVSGYDLSSVTTNCTNPLWQEAIINGQSAIYFNKTEKNCLESLSQPLDIIEAGDHSTYVVFKPVSLPTTGSPLYGKGKVNAGQGNGFVRSGNNLWYRLGDAPAVAMKYTSSISYGTWQVVSAVVQPSDSVGYLNQNAVITSSGILNHGAGNWEGIGRSYSPDPDFGYLDSVVAEIIMYSRDLTRDEHEIVLAYIANKYNFDFSDLSYYSQQNNYINVSDSVGAKKFIVDKFGNIDSSGGATFAEDVDIGGSLSVGNVPIALSSAGNDVLVITHTGGESGKIIADTSNGGGRNFFAFDGGGTTNNIYSLSANIYRVAALYGSPAAGGFAGAYIYTHSAYALPQGVVFATTSTATGIDGCNTYGNGLLRCSDNKYGQLTYTILSGLYNNSKVAIDGNLWMENYSQILLGTQQQARIYHNGTELIINTSSTNFLGNITVGTNALFVDSTTNRVGIGTVSPYSGLHYQGDIFYLTPNAGTDSNDNITIKNYATSNGAPNTVKFPLIVTLPLTSNGLIGVVVPIPTLPPLTINPYVPALVVSISNVAPFPSFISLKTFWSAPILSYLNLTNSLFVVAPKLL